MNTRNKKEIQSIRRAVYLEYQDNMGNRCVIQKGDVEVMSAGTGILNMEFNKNQDQEVQFLQSWVIHSQNTVEP